MNKLLIIKNDLENKINKLSLPAKSKDIGIFCTGGIRCEKASLVLRKLGYKKIYQLRGGIINYLRDKPNSTNWQGECFVFDDRVALNNILTKGKYSQCFEFFG